jgi:glyoxylase I family protein
MTLPQLACRLSKVTGPRFATPFAGGVFSHSCASRQSSRSGTRLALEHWRPLGVNCQREVPMNRPLKQSPSAATENDPLVRGFWGVRYQVEDVDRSIDFYTRSLGFTLDHKHPPAFAQVSSGNLKLILSGPGASGSRAMPDGREQESGGWNRIILQVADLSSRIESLKQNGLHFRNQMESGPGGKQIQIEDPDGNPIELFEPAE